MSYRGDTVGKKIARAMAWTSVMRGNRSYHAERNYRFMYLASHEGGDASVLQSFGVDPRRQLAVDVDPGAIAEFRFRWPDVPASLGDVVDVAREAGKHHRYNVVFLDFCSHLSDEVLRTIVSTLESCATPICTLVVAHMRGREKESLPFIESQRGRRVFGGTEFQLETDDRRPLDDGRLDFLSRRMNARMQSQRREATCYFTITYQSRTEDHPGVPMAIDTFLVGQYRKNDRAPRLASLSTRQRQAVFAANAIAEGLSPVRRFASFDVSDLWRDIDLRDWALGLAGYDTTTIAQRLNIDPRTVSAWRAHETMGTYNFSRYAQDSVFDRWTSLLEYAFYQREADEQ